MLCGKASVCAHWDSYIPFESCAVFSEQAGYENGKKSAILLLGLYGTIVSNREALETPSSLSTFREMTPSLE